MFENCYTILQIATHHMSKNVFVKTLHKAITELFKLNF